MKQSPQSPQMSDDFYRSLLHSVPDAVYIHDRQGRIIEANEAACRQTGYTREALCGLTVQELNPYRSAEDIQSLLVSLSEECCTNHVFRGRHRRQDGSLFPVEVNLTPLQHSNNALFLAVVRDLSEREQLERDLQDKVQFDELLLEISTRLINVYPENIDTVIQQLLADIGAFFKAGRSYVFSIDLKARTFSNTHEWSDEGVDPEIDNLQDLSFDEFPWLMSRILNHQVAHAPDIPELPDEFALEREEYIRQRIRSLIIVPIVRGGEVTGLFGLDTVNEKRYWKEDIRNNLLLLGQLLASAMDAAGMGKQLKHLAYHDPLTQLPNRQLLNERIQQTANRIRRESNSMAVLLLDLDDFKLVNDTMSHSAGDFLLCRVAERLRGIVRESDTVARLGGDEFVIVAQVNGSDEAASLASRALESVSQPINVEAQSIVTHPSIGIALYREGNGDSDTLLRHADLAMYAAKAAGKNRFAFFEPCMTDHARKMLHLRHELSIGLQKNQFILYFQPRIDLRSNQVCGMEALIRWWHPERGLLEPIDFLPLAERSELICRIDHWVLENARMELERYLPRNSSLRVSVNLSARDLYDAEHVDHLLKVIETHYGSSGLPLELEITESTLMHDIDTAIEKLHLIKTAVPHVTIAIDDFGSGYSSLSYLRRLPIDTLKIDQSFVHDLGNEQASSEAIVRSIIELARNLGLRVVAEGIELQSQSEFLKTLGCDEGQGFYFARPLPMVELEAFLVDGLPAGNRPSQQPD